MDKQIIILAAGRGKRMKSALPKMMHPIGGIPMIERVIRNCSMITDDLVLVYSRHIESYLPQFAQNCKLVEQKEQLGTAHAVSVAKDRLDKKKYIAVLYGDNPLITHNIIDKLFNHLKITNSKITNLAFEYNEENEYGRIVCDKNGNFQKIVETKVANDTEKKITLCNSGIMVFAPSVLEKYIDRCLVQDPLHPDKELYFTDIIEIANSSGEKVSYLKVDDYNLIMGVNTQEELSKANKAIVKNQKKYV